MPAHRLTNAEAEASGAREKNPKRFKGREKAPVPTGPLGDPPGFFDDIDRDLWREVENTAPVGVLTSADRFLVEVVVKLLRKLRYPTPENGGITAAEVGHLRSSLGSMGLTPADRTRVSGPGKNAPSQQSPIERLRNTAIRGKAN